MFQQIIKKGGGGIPCETRKKKKKEKRQWMAWWGETEGGLQGKGLYGGGGKRGFMRDTHTEKPLKKIYHQPSSQKKKDGRKTFHFEILH